MSLETMENIEIDSFNIGLNNLRNEIEKNKNEYVRFDDLTNEEKEKVLPRFTQKAEEIQDGIKKLVNPSLSNSNKEEHMKNLLSLFGQDAKITYSSDSRIRTYRNIADFFEQVKDGKIPFNNVKISDMTMDYERIVKIKLPEGNLYDPKINNITISTQ